MDWTRTRAYALGLTGLFLNLQGREAQGIVDARRGGRRAESRDHRQAERPARSDERARSASREAFDTRTLYAGPYLENAPDLLIGYNAGYRTSWDCATGVVAGPVFEDNVKAVERRSLHRPAARARRVLLQPPRSTPADPALIDIAPTALRLFGIEPPPYMDGTPRLDGPRVTVA